MIMTKEDRELARENGIFVPARHKFLGVALDTHRTPEHHLAVLADSGPRGGRHIMYAPDGRPILSNGAPRISDGNAIRSGQPQSNGSGIGLAPGMPPISAAEDDQRYPTPMPKPAPAAKPAAVRHVEADINYRLHGGKEPTYSVDEVRRQVAQRLGLDHRETASDKTEIAAAKPAGNTVAMAVAKRLGLQYDGEKFSVSEKKPQFNPASWIDYSQSKMK